MKQLGMMAVVFRRSLGSLPFPGYRQRLNSPMPTTSTSSNAPRHAPTARCRAIRASTTAALSSKRKKRARQNDAHLRGLCGVLCTRGEAVRPSKPVLGHGL